MKFKDGKVIQKGKEYEKTHLILLIGMVSILLLIISSVTLLRIEPKIMAEAKTPIMLQQLEFNQPKLNECEQDILSMTYFGLGLSDKKLEDSTSFYRIYFYQLVSYFSKQDIVFDDIKMQEVKSIIEKMNTLITLEQGQEPSKMSIDGRGIVMILAEELYELCGLNLVHSMNGDINQILDENGTLIYSVDSLQMEERVHIKALVITLSVTGILFVICFIVAKSNGLFVRDVKIHGVEKKGFA